MKRSDCIHDLNDENNTLIVSPKRNLVFPQQMDCICSICKKVLKFKRDDDGKYKRIRKFFG